MDAWLSDAVASVRDEVIDTRRQLHAAPELSMVEHDTTALVRDRLTEIGADLLECPTETGAVATIGDPDAPGPAVLVRADIDALPINEDPGHPFASEREGVMHACGHDGHTAILLGVARCLADRADEMGGHVLLVFQPGEELAGGANQMLAGGLLEGQRVDAVFGLHLSSSAPTGLVGMKPGTAWAGADVFTMTVTGEGGHGALTGSVGNPLMAVATIAQRLSEVATDLSYEGVAPVCSAGTLHAGQAANVVPGRATLQGTLRSFTPDQRDECLRRLHALLAEVDTAFETHTSADFGEHVPPVYNDPAVVGRLFPALRAQLGDTNVFELPPITTSDDMAELLRAAPGAYAVVGAGIDDGRTRHHHTARFDIDEAGLDLGVAMLLAGTLELCGPPSTP